MDDVLDAFCTYNDAKLHGSAAGPLADLTFAAKDIFDIAGHVTGAGHPDWLRTHEPAADTAPVVQRLLDAGADLVGKTQCTELTRGIVGDNVHYSMPKNPRAPGRVPGGSSSGSASAVAGELVDFALGSDTNGSIRGPASFCGIFGMRPTHGRIPLDGVFKHAPSFDTVGWFARDAELLARVGAVLLEVDVPDVRPRRIVVSEDAFALVDGTARASLSRAVSGLEKLVPDLQHAKVCSVELKKLFDAHRVLHGKEAWEQFRGWFEETNPRLSFQVAQLCFRGSSHTAEDAERALRFLKPVHESMSQLLSEGTLVCLPTMASMAWPADTRFSEIAESHLRSVMLVTIGTSLGAPQVSLPLAESDGFPLGLSLLGPRGSDAELLGFCRAVAQALL